MNPIRRWFVLVKQTLTTGGGCCYVSKPAYLSPFTHYLEVVL